jgi:pimeloyl-ACP methyl ester carboxylesterase
MQWRRIAIAGGAAVGAAAAYNRIATRGVEPLENEIGGDEGTFGWHGHRITFTKRGQGDPVLLVHAIHPTASSLEWRHNVDALAESHTVYTIDLLGFGRSARPDVRYSARLYLRLLDDFTRYAIGQPCTLVARSLSAAYAAVLGARDPGRFPALVLIGPTGITRRRDPAGTRDDVARLVVDLPLVGTSLFNLLVSRAAIRRQLERAYADDALVTDALVDAHFATAHQPGARYAPAAFLSHHLDIDARDAVRRLAQPVLLVWGEQAQDEPVDDVRAFLALDRRAALAIFEHAGALPHDERPDDFNAIVAEFLAPVGEPETAGSGHGTRA